MTAGRLRVEDALDRYAIDDQVRIVVVIPGTPDTDWTLFEGTIQRMPVELKHEGVDAFGMPREGEGVFLAAFADTWRDDVMEHHPIAGRWFNGEANGGLPRIIYSRTMPVVFNLGGRPNMTPDTQVFTPAPSGGGAALTDCRAFTTDDDPDAEMWTLGEAIKSILGFWLYGGTSASYSGYDNIDLDRHVDVEDTTAAALNVGSADAMFTGLDKPLPEIAVEGDGPIAAVKKLCRKMGFIATTKCLPDALGNNDTRYVLAIRRRHTGRSVALNIANPGDYEGEGISPAQYHQNNDVNQLRIIIDGEGLRNIVSVRGESYMEARFTLFPLWDDADECTEALTKEDQETIPLTPGDQTTYQSQHVAGGDQFSDYAHVGRRWGIACSTREPHKTSPAAYDITQDVNWAADVGFDFVGYLGLNATGDFKTARTNAGITADVEWSNRPRNLLPLRSVDARAAGVRFVLEISEDGGSNWTRVPRNTLKFSTDPDLCAIWLNVKNLAAVDLTNLITKSGDNRKATIRDRLSAIKVA